MQPVLVEKGAGLTGGGGRGGQAGTLESVVDI